VTTKVLYVEHDDDNLYMLKTRLERRGNFEVLAAEDSTTPGWPGSFATMSATNHWLSSGRDRVGFIGWSKTACYVTGGAAWASTEYNGHMTHYRR
jgi:hypothetical protein